MRAYLMALLAALERNVPLVHPTMRHNVRLSRIGKEDRLVICMAGQCEVVLDDDDFKDDPDILAITIVSALTAAKEAKRLIEEKGGRAS